MHIKRLRTGIFKNIPFMVGLNIILTIIILSGQYSLADSQFIKIPDQQKIDSFESVIQRDECTLTNYYGPNESILLDLNDGDMIIEYFDPADYCGPDPIYPFSLTSIEFQLYDNDDYVDFTWPCPVNIVVYDAANTEECPFPHTSPMYSYSYICDSLIFCNPKSGVVDLPLDWCIDSAFFIGIEYTGTADAYPSIRFDDTPDPTHCHLYGYDNSEPEPAWSEWYVFCGPSVAGYPSWRVYGETKSPFCGTGTLWWNEPGGTHLPDFDFEQRWPEYSGPTTAANCLWWFDQRFPEWDIVPSGSSVPDFIESLGTMMSTNVEPPIGTDIDSLVSGVEQFLDQRGLLQTLAVTKIDQPSYDYCREQLLDGDYQILQIGNWHADSIKYDVPTVDCMEIYWTKTGEQYVNMTGVSPIAEKVGISDPANDRAISVPLPQPPSRVIGTNHTRPDGHDDGLSVSYDAYDVSILGFTPGGLWSLPNYNSYSKKKADAEGGESKSETSQYRAETAVTVWCDDEPGWFHPSITVAEIEAVVIISPVRNPVIGKTSHNLDGYSPQMGDPTGFDWKELWPDLESEWELTDWSDNGDGHLSFCDTIEVTYSSSGWVTREHIEWIGPTIRISDQDNPSTIIYLEEIDPNSMVDDITEPVGTRWHEVYPNYGQIWEALLWYDDGDDILGYLDMIMLSLVNGSDMVFYNVDEIKTDIVTTPLVGPGDEYDHNTDDYIPILPDGDPTETTWHELWPNYDTDWILTEWRDNTDGILSRGDSVKFTGQVLPDSIIWKLIEKVTPTITISENSNTYYMDYMGYDPNISPIPDPVGTYWHETYPQYSHRWLCQDWTDEGDGSLGIGDDITLLVLDGDDSGLVVLFQVDDWDTDIISTYIFPNAPDPFESDLNIHNIDEYNPVDDGDPAGTQWTELWPVFDRNLTLTSWFDIDGNSKLSVGDYIDLSNDITEEWNKYDVDWVGPTLTVLSDQTTIYLEYIGFDNPDVDNIDDPRGTYWHEVYPNYSRTYVLLDWTGYGYLDNGDNAIFRNVNTNEDMSVIIEAIETDIILTKIAKVAPNPLPDGTIMHNTDIYPHYMPDQDPNGSQWEKFLPSQNWIVTGWFDDSDGNLSINDYLDFYNPVSHEWNKLQVDWVGPTIQISLEQNTLYLDYVGFDKTDMSDITDVIGKYWQELSPAQGTYYFCVGWTDGEPANGKLDYDDNLVLQNMTTGLSALYHVDDLVTDIIVSEIELPDQIQGIYLHNQEGWKPTDGDPTNSNWHELWPTYDQDWELTGWTDNSDSKLSVDDAATFNSLAEPEYYVRWLGPTLKISLGEDTLYLDYMAADNPDVESISDPAGMFWYEVHPVYYQKYFCTDWTDEGDGFLGNGDDIILQEMTAGTSQQYVVRDIQTDIIINDVLACDCVPGEIDGIPKINILDIVYLINYKYKSGPDPIPYEICSGDVELDCIINILDIVYLINFKYKSGEALPVCEDWTTECGSLRK